MRLFQHVGVPTTESHPGEVYVAETKVWVTSPDDHPQHIEYLRFEPDSPVKGPARDLPHMAFRVDSLADAIGGENVILGPFEASPGLQVAFIHKDGAVFEFMEYASESALPWR
ncbi:MAG: hypothetical protein HY321_18020 [Armatimonadetes bacterium]|nr:hypothetical protein [Armatimonadota bacterium]